MSMFVMTSCYTTWTTVGNYDQLEKQGMKSYQYDKKKQYYLFSLIPLGHSHAKTPNEPCEIISRKQFSNYLLNMVTFGIVDARTVTVNALEGGKNHQISIKEDGGEVAKTNTPPTSSFVPTKSLTNMPLKVGDRVCYKLKGQWWYYATITAITNGSVTIELQNGVTTERSVEDVIKIEYLK